MRRVAWCVAALAVVPCCASRAWAQTISAQPLPPPGGSAAAPASPRPGIAVPGTAVPGTAAPAHPATHHRRKPKAPLVHAPPGPPKRAAPARPAGHVASKAQAKPVVSAKPAPAAAAAPPPPPRPDPNKGTSTGLPLPRWVSLRSDEVNLRSGPGMQYPIQWVYHRRDYPVQILREFDVWRLVQDQDGTKGWVHQATLTGRRGFVVAGGPQILRAAPSDTADAVAELMAGVVGLIRQCPAGSDWCAVQAGSYRGWLKRSATYGIFPNEVIG
jgi:SH3-like domain-containing protein